MQDGGGGCVGRGRLCWMKKTSLDCIDPSEARFSPKVNLDMEKIMEKLGGVGVGWFQVKNSFVDEVSLCLASV